MAVTSMANSSIRDFTKFNSMAATFTAGPFACTYLVIAGGGGTGNTDLEQCGAGGAGGMRSNFGSTGGGGSVEDALTLGSGAYSVVVGAGGSPASDGSDSSFHTVDSSGGGFGGVIGRRREILVVPVAVVVTLAVWGVRELLGRVSREARVNPTPLVSLQMEELLAVLVARGLVQLLLVRVCQTL